MPKVTFHQDTWRYQTLNLEVHGLESDLEDSSHATTEGQR